MFKDSTKKLSLLKKIEEVEVKKENDLSILHYQKGKTGQMQFYGYVRMLLN